MNEEKEYYSHYPDRYVCSVIDEMRKCHETRNYAILPSLIEEMQTMVNRMEAGLSEQKSMNKLSEDFKKLRVEYNELVTEYNDLNDKGKK